MLNFGEYTIKRFCSNTAREYEIVIGKVADLNSSSPMHFRKLYWNESSLKFLFLHFFVALQKVL